jgi:hypothetical protein
VVHDDAVAAIQSTVLAVAPDVSSSEDMPRV